MRSGKYREGREGREKGGREGCVPGLRIAGIGLRHCRIPAVSKDRGGMDTSGEH